MLVIVHWWLRDPLSWHSPSFSMLLSLLRCFSLFFEHLLFPCLASPQPGWYRPMVGGRSVCWSAGGTVCTARIGLYGMALKNFFQPCFMAKHANYHCVWTFVVRVAYLLIYRLLLITNWHETWTMFTVNKLGFFLQFLLCLHVSSP